MSINGCELVKSSKRLAKEKGLPPDDVLCFYGQMSQCIETACAMIKLKNNRQWGKNQLTKFYARLSKHREIINR